MRIVDVGTGCRLCRDHAGAGIPRRFDIGHHRHRHVRRARGGASQRLRLGAPGVDSRLGSLVAEVPGPIDLIVSNPPYVPVRDRHLLQQDVVGFEPAGALFGGDDGLAVIRQLIPAARQFLAPHSALMLEIGVDQADRVEAPLKAARFTSIHRHQDLQGIDRIIVARLAGGSL